MTETAVLFERIRRDLWELEQQLKVDAKAKGKAPATCPKCSVSLAGPKGMAEHLERIHGEAA